MSEQSSDGPQGPIRPMSEASDSLAEELLRSAIMAPPRHPGVKGQIGRFEVLRVLGEGGMGLALLTREPVTDAQVVVKVIKPRYADDPDMVRRFLNEATHMYKLSHPNILSVLEVSDSPGCPYLAMSYIEDGSLRDRLNRGEKLTKAFLLSVLRQVAEALTYAHGVGIIHRDLKPANILIDAEGHAYLMDFGLVRTLFNDSMLDVQSRRIEGTLAYLSPQAAAGRAEDTRCDIYSFGAMLYELLTGQRPYSGRTPEDVLAQIRESPPPPIREITPNADPGLSAIAEGAMARELRDRYAEMADIVRDLERVADGRTPLGPHADKKTTGRRGVFVAAAALLLVIGGVGLWQLSHRVETEPPTTGPHPPTAPANANWRTLSDQADRSLDENRFEDARELYGEALAALDADPALDSTIRGTFATKLTRNLDLTKFILARRELPVEQQIEVTQAKLKEYNPEYDGKGEFTAEAGQIIGARLARTKLGNLGPLRGLPLESLNCLGNRITDLAPLRGMPLEGLTCSENLIHDLTPLAGVPLQRLICARNRIQDLKPLEGMPLTHLDCYLNRISSLEPLRGLPLKELLCYSNGGIADLAPVRGAPLRRLYCQVTSVSNLEALAESPINELNIARTKVRDLSPLAGKKLWLLRLSPKTAANGWHVLREMSTLKRLEFETPVGEPPLEKLKGLPISLWPAWDTVVLRSLRWGTPRSELQPVDRVARQLISDFGSAPLCASFLAALPKLLEGVRTMIETGECPPPQAQSFGRNRYMLMPIPMDWSDAQGFCVSNGAHLATVSDAMEQDWLTKTYGRLVSRAWLGGSRNKATEPFQWCTGEPWSYENWGDGQPEGKPNENYVVARDDGPWHDCGATNRSLCFVMEWEGAGNSAALSPWRASDDAAATAHDENRFEEAAKLYDEAIVALAKDSSLDSAIVAATKSDLEKQRAFVQFILDRAKLSPELQIAATQAKLKEMNPEYDGKGTFEVEGDSIVRARLVKCGLVDLRPLKGLTLTRLYADGNQLRTLAPLKGMRLEWLALGGNRVSDLSPLRGMPLKRLFCVGNCITNIAALHRMPLECLDLEANQSLSDLSPLEGVPLRTLHVGHTEVTDLTPLRGSPLSLLHVQDTAVSNLAPVASTALGQLAIHGTKITDLSPLAGLEVKRLHLTPRRVTRGWDVLRSMKSLKVLDGWGHVTGTNSPSLFWKKYDLGYYGNEPTIEITHPEWRRRWSLSLAARLPVCKGQVHRLAFSPDGTRLAAAGEDGTVTLWDTERQELVGRAVGHSGRAIHVAFSPDGKRLASGGSDLNVRLWDAETLTNLQFTGPGNLGNCGITFSPTNDIMAVGRSKTPEVLLLDYGGKRVGKLDCGTAGRTGRSAFSPSGEYLVTCGNHLKVWRTDTFELVRDVHPSRSDLLYSVEFSPDGNSVAGCSSDGSIRIWDFSTWELKHVLHGHQDEVFWVAFNAPASLLVSASTDGTVRLWDTETWLPVGSVRSAPKNVSGVAISPDGNLLATGDDDGYARLWQVHELQGENGRKHEASLTAADAAFDENRFAEAAAAFQAALSSLEQSVGAGDVLAIQNWVFAKSRIAQAKWYVERDSLPVDRQIPFIQARLKELNPEYNGSGKLGIENGRIGTASLNSTGLSHLSPLRGLLLTELEARENAVSDLSPLKGMPLIHLDLRNCLMVSDLSPVREFPLQFLDIEGTAVNDLSPIEGMPLAYLKLYNCPRLSDLSPVGGLPLKYLCIGGTAVADLTLLEGMQLEELRFNKTEIADLSPLRGMPLKAIHLSCTPVSNLVPLSGMELEEVSLTPGNVKQSLDVLRSMPSLKEFRVHTNTTMQAAVMRAEEFWKRHNKGEF
jgi:serine/threonine protein kinase/WD40 repeat protein